MKLSAAYATNVSLNPDSVPEPVVITITSGKFTRQLTVHRPIGITPLGGDCWIITQTGDVPAYLNHTKDPSYEKKAEARRTLRKAIAVELGLIKEDGTYTGDLAAKGAKSLAAGLVEAKAAHEKAAAEAHRVYLDECKQAGRAPKKDWKFNQDINHFLPQNVKDAEGVLAEKVRASPKWMAGLKIIEPEPFETKGGTFHNQSQVPFCSNNCKPEQMVDMLQQHIMYTMTSTEGKFFPLGSKNPAFGYESSGVASGDPGQPGSSAEGGQPMSRKTFLEKARTAFAARASGASTTKKG